MCPTVIVTLFMDKHRDANKCLFMNPSICLPPFTSSVIVGAPKEDTSKYQQDVHRGGAVFKCDIRENNQCIMIPFDRNGELTILSATLIDHQYEINQLTNYNYN